MTDAAARLVALADEEHRLVLEGRWEELDALHVRREEAMTLLGDLATAPTSDRPALEHALRVQRLTSAALQTRTVELSAQLKGVGTTRRAAKAYRAATGA